MKTRIIARIAAVLAVTTMLICFSGCEQEKTKEDYEAIISEHVQNRHNDELRAIDGDFEMDEDGLISVDVEQSKWLWIVHMKLDQEGHIVYCSQCDARID